MTPPAGFGEQSSQPARLAALRRIFPFLTWFHRYDTGCLQSDLIAGVTVALVLIPQSMAYAQLADLPAYYGLYAAFLPPLFAALFGSSRQLATGPVAVVSLMTATSLAPLATAGSEAFIAYAVMLALLVGVFQFLLGVLRLGIVVNFLSHPVVNGFTNAAAIIIATSQLGKLLGVTVDRAEHHYETVYRTIEAAFRHMHWPTVALGLLAFAVMAILKRINPRLPNVLFAVAITTVIAWAVHLQQDSETSLDRIQVPELRNLVTSYNANAERIDETMVERIAKGQELKAALREHGSHSLEAIDLEAEVAKLEIVMENYRERNARLRAQVREYRLVAVETAGAGPGFYESADVPAGAQTQGNNWQLKIGNRQLDPAALAMQGGGAVVGTIPPGIPALAVPKIDPAAVVDLASMAVIISLLGFMEAISIAKAMANRTGQQLDPNQELIGQGLANIVGSFASSYPVSGSFSRSAVNIQAGAVTGLSSIFSSAVVLITLLFLTPLLYYLPQSVLAAIIIMAVIGLVNFKGFIHAWQAQRADGIIAVLSFVCTLAFAPHLDRGIIIGVALSLALYLFRNMRPKVEVLSRTSDGHFRNADRWELETCDHVAVIRFNGSLIFANVNFVENQILREVGQRPVLKHVLLVGNGINEMDASGEVMLSFLISKLRISGIDISFSGLNDQVIDVMKRTQMYEKIGADHVYLSVDDAIRNIHRGACLETREADCPLLRSRQRGEEVGRPPSESRITGV